MKSFFVKIELDKILFDRYYIICFILFIAMIGNAIYGELGTADFWGHCAAVKELSDRPFNPLNPFFVQQYNFPLFSPYLLFLGMLSKLTSLLPTTVLRIMGLVNLLMFFIGIRLFIKCFFENSISKTSFYALLFIIFFNTSYNWCWSGFLNFKALCFVLPYPSTFSVSLSLILFAGYFRFFSRLKLSYIYLILLPLCTAIVILTHPITAVFTMIGIFSITLHQVNKNGLKILVYFMVILIITSVFVFLWPYYSFFDLIYSNNFQVHTDSLTLYNNCFKTVWPYLVLSPILFCILCKRIKKNILDAIFLAIFFLILVYILGYITEKYAAGRVISQIMLICQILLGAKIAELECLLNFDKKKHMFYISLVLFMLIGLLNFNDVYGVSCLKRIFFGLKGYHYSYADYSELSNYIASDDLILSDLDTNWMLPSFNGKVIAHWFPMYGVKDIEQKRGDLKLFFSNIANKDLKQKIINKYNPGFLVINKLKTKNYSDYNKFGIVVFENAEFILIKPK